MKRGIDKVDTSPYVGEEGEVFVETPTKRMKRDLAYKFVEAAAKGDTTLVTKFLEAGIDPNCLGDASMTALMATALSRPANHLEIISLLMARGADPYIQNSLGGSALYTAQRYGDLAAFNLLSGLNPVSFSAQLRYLPLYDQTLQVISPIVFPEASEPPLSKGFLLKPFD